jgi:hypothetical protein
MRLVLATLVAVLALSTPAFAGEVTNVTVDNTVPSNAAGARTTYVVGFTTTTGVLSQAGDDRITVAFPAGTGLDDWGGGDVRAAATGATVIGSCRRKAGDSEIECYLHSNRSIAAGQAVQVTLDGIANPPISGQVRVSTTKDADQVGAPFAVVPAGDVSEITLDNSAPSRAAGAQTVFVARLKLSSTGGLSAQAGSRLYVTLPWSPGSGGWEAGTVRDVTADADVGSCYSPVNATSECYLHSGRSIADGSTVELTLAGLSNPTAPGTDKVIQVRTTSDPADMPSAPFTVVAANPVSAVSVDNGTPSGAAGARTRYLVGLTLSATGGLSDDADSRLYVTFPSGTTFNGWDGGRVTVDGTEVGSCYSPVDRVSDCYLHTNRSIAPGAQVTIAFDGITNPTAVSTQQQVIVSTTSDPASVPSAAYSVVPAGTMSAATVANGTPSAAATARTRYLIAFKLSATGGLADNANSRLFVTFPTGTTFVGWGGARISVAGTEVGSCQSPVGRVSECYLHFGRSIAAGADVSVAFAGVTNPETAGADKVVTISTTSDPQAIASAPFGVVAGGSVAGVSVAAGSLAPSARTDYVVGLTTSATGALTDEANSELYFGFPAGSTFTGWGGGTVQSVATGLDVGACYRPVALVSDCYLFFGRLVGAGTQLRVTFEGVTNPATAGPYRMTVSTTSDTPAVTSPDPGQGEPQPPAAPSVSGTSGAIESGGAAAFEFGSAEPGVSFQCSIDDTVFSACTSPAAYSGLAPGGHTFRVRAVDAAGLAGPPSARSFTVAGTPQATPTPSPTVQPTPTATPQPTPAPTPAFKEDVVVAPVSGTVKVCPKGPTRACTTLPAGSAIPMGSTVDARKGVVELTSLSAAGATPQTARFSKGMFKVSQSGSTTNLTLNEPLDCRTKKKARAAQKKTKAKKRKLWGDGKGKFRTRGSYSAATVRGTKWLVQDTCTTTLTRVTQGVVSVRDSVKRKTITVRKGKRYTARARGG